MTAPILTLDRDAWTLAVEQGVVVAAGNPGFDPRFIVPSTTDRPASLAPPATLVALAGKACDNGCERFGGKLPGHVYGSNWDWVPCQSCFGSLRALVELRVRCGLCDGRPMPRLDLLCCPAEGCKLGYLSGHWPVEAVVPIVAWDYNAPDDWAHRRHPTGAILVFQEPDDRIVSHIDSSGVVRRDDDMLGPDPASLIGSDAVLLGERVK